MPDETFWKSALKATGVAAVGAFVLFGLFRSAIDVNILNLLGPQLSFALLVLFMILVFVLAMYGFRIHAQERTDVIEKPEDEEQLAEAKVVPDAKGNKPILSPTAVSGGDQPATGSENHQETTPSKIRLAVDHLEEFRRREPGRDIVFGSVDLGDGMAAFGEGVRVHLTVENMARHPSVVSGLCIRIDAFDPYPIEDFDYSQVAVPPTHLEVPGSTIAEPLQLTEAERPGSTLRIPPRPTLPGACEHARALSLAAVLGDGPRVRALAVPHCGLFRTRSRRSISACYSDREHHGSEKVTRPWTSKTGTAKRSGFTMRPVRQRTSSACLSS